MQVSLIGFPTGNGAGQGAAAGNADAGFAQALEGMLAGMPIGAGNPAGMRGNGAATVDAATLGAQPNGAAGDPATEATALLTEAGAAPTVAIPANGAKPAGDAANLAVAAEPNPTLPAPMAGPLAGEAPREPARSPLSGLQSRPTLAQLLTTATATPSPVSGDPQAPAATTLGGQTPATRAANGTAARMSGVAGQALAAALAANGLTGGNAPQTPGEGTQPHPAAVATDADGKTASTQLSADAPLPDTGKDMATPQPDSAAAAVAAGVTTGRSPTPIPVQPETPARGPRNAGGSGARRMSDATAPANPTTMAAGGATPTTGDAAAKTDATAARTPRGGVDASGAGDPAPARGSHGDAATPSFAHQLAATGSGAAMPASEAGTKAAAEPVVNARPGQIGHAMGVEIARSVGAGQDTLRVRMNPGELGRVEVTLQFDDKGTLQATVRAESAHALELLRQDAPQLARTLDQAGIRADAQSFRFESRSGDSNGFAQQQSGGGQGQQQGRGRYAATDDNNNISEAAYRPVRSDGQVDLLA